MITQPRVEAKAKKNARGQVANNLATQQYVDAAAGGALKGTVTVTVPANRLEWTETVAATGVTGASVAMICLAPHADGDENDAELLDIAAMSALPGTDSLTIDLAFLTPTQGPIKINWSAF